MINRTIGRLSVKVYESIEELPTERYHKFNVYCLMDSGIGSDVTSVDNHITDLFQALGRKDFERLQIQLQNYYHSLRLILDGTDLHSLAFACLVHSVNGKETKSLDEESLKKLSGKISANVKRQEIINLFTDLKKKLRLRLSSIFPTKDRAIK